MRRLDRTDPDGSQWAARTGAVSAVAAVLTSGALLAIPPRAPAGPVPGTAPAGLPDREWFQRFHKMSPAERLRLVEKFLRGGQGLHKVARGDVTVEVVERGTLEPAERSDVFCRFKTRGTDGKVATTVKWVIDDDTFVKKGQRLVELDDSFLQELLGAQRITVAQARAARDDSAENFKQLAKENEIEVRLGEIELKLAQLDLKHFTEDDSGRKQVLELKVEQARLRLERLQNRAKAAKARAVIESRARDAVLALDVGRQREIEDQVRQCTILAPQDGLVIYYIPEHLRGGGGAQQALVAQGEPVREGQKLLQVCDLKRFVVNTRIHEALVFRVHAGQRALVRVDAFPESALAGRVTEVATIATQQDFFSADVKVYQTRVALTGDAHAGLKPGMSAEVRIVIGERTGVISAPAQAVLGAGKERLCYVKTPQGIEEHRVTTGLGNDSVVEIKEGLTEGEQILANPRTLLEDPGLRNDGAQAPAGPRAEILVQSVKPADAEAASRRRVVAYGITFEDLERLAAIPGVTQVLPVRHFPQEVRRLERKFQGGLVAAPPAIGRRHGLKLAAGRFLNDEDELRMQNRVLLGADVAEALFPGEGALGQSVVLDKGLWVVVGVLRRQREEVNRSVLVPLRTYKARFGRLLVVRQAHSFRAEEVPLNEVLITVETAGEVPGTVEAVRELLEREHSQKDWEIRTPLRP